MNPPRIRFWPTVAIVFVMTVTIALGFWQRDRAHQKEARQLAITTYQSAPPVTLGAAAVPVAVIEYHRVRLRGHFLASKAVYLDNRPYQDQPGFYLLMPFAVAGGRHVLVNRGWLPRNPLSRTAIAPYQTPPGEIDIEGVARADASRTLVLTNKLVETGQAIRQNLDLSAYASETKLDLQPFVVMQTNDTHDGLIRDWPKPAADVSRNYGYMLQWWGIAAAALGLGLYLAFYGARPTGSATSTQRNPRE